MRAHSIAMTMIAVGSLSLLPAQQSPAPQQVGTTPAPAGEAVPPGTSAPAPGGEAVPPSATPAPEAAPAPESPLVIAADHPAAPSMERAKDTLSVDFPDEDIRNILRNVADLFELNLVVPDTLQGRTSIKLRDVTWRQIFQVVLSPVGYTFLEDGNIIRVVAQDTLAAEPVSTEVFIINYAKAAEIKTSVEPLVEAAVGGRVIVDTRSNALVITERPSRMSKIRPIIEKLDRATDQVMIESKFVEVSNRDSKNIGVNWSSLSGYKAGVGSLEKRYTKTDSNSGSDTSKLSIVAPNATYTNDVISTLSGATDRIATAVFSADDFSVILSALKTQSDTKLVSNPTVVTLNNSEANINIGEEFPVPNYTYNSERGTFEVSGFEYKQIGIILKVTPQVNGAGFIKLSIEPEVSSRNGTTTFGDAEIPIISTRKTKTQVTLKDGYTMGIGGLIENTTTNGNSKVPVLGSIPGLGRLFKSDSQSVDTRNLLIFITAKTVSPDGAALTDVFDPRTIRNAGLKKDELPGYRDGSDPFPPPPPPKKPMFRLTPGGDPSMRSK